MASGGAESASADAEYTSRMMQVMHIAQQINPGNGVIADYNGRKLDGTVMKVEGDTVKVWLTDSQKPKKFQRDKVELHDSDKSINLTCALYGAPKNEGLRMLSDVAAVVPGAHGGSKLCTHKPVKAGEWFTLDGLCFTLGKMDAAILQTKLCAFASTETDFVVPPDDPTYISTGKFVGMFLSSQKGKNIMQSHFDTWDYFDGNNMQFMLRHQMQYRDYVWLAYWIREFDGVYTAKEVARMLFMLLVFAWVYDHTVVLDAVLCKADCPDADWQRMHDGCREPSGEDNIILLPPVVLDRRQTLLRVNVGHVVFRQNLPAGSDVMPNYGPDYIIDDIFEGLEMDDKMLLKDMLSRIDDRLAAAFEAVHMQD